MIISKFSGYEPRERKPWEVEPWSRGTWDEDFVVVQKESSSEKTFFFQKLILTYKSTNLRRTVRQNSPVCPPDCPHIWNRIWRVIKVAEGYLSEIDPDDLFERTTQLCCGLQNCQDMSHSLAHSNRKKICSTWNQSKLIWKLLENIHKFSTVLFIVVA